MACPAYQKFTPNQDRACSDCQLLQVSLPHPPPQPHIPYNACFPRDLTYSSATCNSESLLFKDAGSLAKDARLCNDAASMPSTAHKALDRRDAASAASSMSSSFSPPSNSDDEEDASTCSSTSSTLSQSTQDDSSEQEGPLNNLTSLSAALPIKRGLSCFFSGKSQSFSSLAQVSSVADLAKSENPFVKRRRTGVDGGHGNSRGAADCLSPKHQSFPPPSRWARRTAASVERRPTSNRFRTFKPILLGEEAALQSDAEPKPRPVKCFSVPTFQRTGF